MKKFTRVILIMAAVLLMTCPVNAEGLFMEISGKTDSNALSATVMVLNKGTNISNIKSEDIEYIAQSDINADGTYTIKLPLNLDYDNLSTYLNMRDINLPGAPEYSSILYVSANRNDTNSGLTKDAPLKTLTSAYEKAKMPAKVVLLTNCTYTDPTKGYKGTTMNIYGHIDMEHKR